MDLCGATLVDISVEHRGPRLANAIVWLEGISAGKRLPVARRYDITTSGCRILPRVQAAAAGGTLDVRNDDDGSHIDRFTSWPGGGLVAIVSETEAGAVVPSPTVLAKPGLVLVRCDLHPWSRGGGSRCSDIPTSPRPMSTEPSQSIRCRRAAIASLCGMSGSACTRTA